MEQLALGTATIVYEDPEDGRTEQTVDNEEILYVRDHWVFPTGTDEQGNDRMRQIPRDRVHHVDRSVEQFAAEAKTVRHRVESIAEDLRQIIPVDIGDGERQRQHTQTSDSQTTGTTVEIDTSEESSEAEEQ